MVGASTMSADFPKITLGFISCERLHYLRATLESARQCIDYPRLEWIVIDDDSEEPGLREYIHSCDWIQHKVFKRQTHADAMNQLVEMATGEYVLIWPEDVQFITSGDWLLKLVQLLQLNPDIGGVCLDAQRLCTLENIFKPSLRECWRRFRTDWLRYGLLHIRRQRRLVFEDGFTVWTYGSYNEGVVGSGIPSLMRTSIWRQLGPWKVAKPEAGIIDSSLGAEDDMIDRVRKSGLRLQMAALHIPVAADIINDDIGCKAKVRKGIRYGNYTPPPDGGALYYQISSFEERQESALHRRPLSFTECVVPLGFEIPMDANGDRLKASFNDQTSEPIGS
jgi:hypothetical protein